MACHQPSRMNISPLFFVSLLFILSCGGGGGGGGPGEVTNNSLSVSVTGGGTITSNPTGINCGSDCNQDYSSTTRVSLAATPDNGFTFNGWGGACSGTGDCRFEMTTNRTVTADFVNSSTGVDFDLTVTVTGPGRVTSSPAGIDCLGDCTETYAENTQVTLTAIPDQGFALDHWDQQCSGNRNCIVNMDGDQNVTAIFAEIGQTSVLIENYIAPNDAFTLGGIPNNASGITWHPNIQQYLIVRNGSALIYRYDIDFQFLGTISISGISNDTEGLGYVADNFVMVVSEDNRASKIEIDETTDLVSGALPNSQRYDLLPFTVSNKGLEGVTVRPGVGGALHRVYACQEGTGTNSEADMRVVYFDMPDPDPGVLLSYDSNLEVIEPFNAEQAFNGIVTDLAGMMYDQRTGHLIILSQEGRKALQVNPDTGAIISELDLSGAPQFEGVTLGPNNELVFVSEPNSVRIYTMN